MDKNFQHERFQRYKKEFEGMQELFAIFKNQRFLEKSGDLYLSMSV